MLGFATTYSYSWKRSQRRRFWASNCSGVLSKISGYCFHKHISKKCLGVSKNIRWFFRTRGKKMPSRETVSRFVVAPPPPPPDVKVSSCTSELDMTLIVEMLRNYVWNQQSVLYRDVQCQHFIRVTGLENKKLWSVRSQTQNCHQKTIVTRLFPQSHLMQCLYIY